MASEQRGKKKETASLAYIHTSYTYVKLSIQGKREEGTNFLSKEEVFFIHAPSMKNLTRDAEQFVKGFWRKKWNIR